MNATDTRLVKHVFEEQVLFNRVLGLRLESISEDYVTVMFSMQDALIGNPLKKNLHGGVIASVIDVTGGVAAFVGMYNKIENNRLEDASKFFSRLGTIDMRVDYLRPGTGKTFSCKGYTLRHGSKVTVVRTELHDDQEALIAVGTSSYIVG